MMRRSVLGSLVLVFLVASWLLTVHEVRAFINPFDDRSTAEQWSDFQVKGAILTILEKRRKSLVEEINIDPWQGRVLITGVVGSVQDRDFIIQKARGVKGVRTVYNHIQVVKKEILKRRKAGRGGKEIKQALHDGAINNRIRVRLATEEASIKSANYLHRIVLGHTYVIGFARSAKEKKSALKVIRETPGVKDVKDYIEIVKISTQ